MTVSPLFAIPPLEVTKHHFARRSLLPVRKDTLWRIDSGIVRTSTWLEDGTVIPLGLWGPGDIVGKLLSKCNPYQIECLTKKVTVTALPVHSWYNSSDVWLKHLEQSEELTIIRGYKRVDVRLYQLLTWLANKFGTEVEQGYLIDIGLTHQEIADLLGITRVTITRTLSQFEQQNLILRLSHHRIILQKSASLYFERQCV